MSIGPDSIWREPPFLVGLSLTLIVLCAFIYALFALPVDTGETQEISKWVYLTKATPNEIGDTLAGIAGSLAFVWLVVTVMLQAKELREQRREFKKMSDAMEEQTSVFRLEQKQREEEYASLQADELLRHIKSDLEQNWFDGFILPTNLSESIHVEPSFQVEEDLRTAIPRGALSLSTILTALNGAIASEFDLSPEVDSVFITNDLQDTFDLVLSAVEFLALAGPATRMRYSNSGLSELEEWIKKLNEMAQ